MNLASTRARVVAISAACGALAACMWIGASLRGAPTNGDPHPPTVASLPATTAPSARDNSQVTFHAPPNPLPAGATTSDWPSFLGPHHNLACDETRLSHDLPADGPPMVWEMEKGSGYSAPGVLGDRLVLLHRVEDQEIIECLQTETGKRFWHFDYPTTYVDRYGYNDGPRSSPVISQDSDSVFSISAEGVLHCIELTTGRLRWRRDLPADFKLQSDFFGWGTSPLVYQDKLIINVGSRKGPCVVAFEQKSGKVVWSTPHEGWGASYATPVPATFHGQARVLVFAGGESNPPTGGLLCINPTDGQLDFAFPWRGTRRESVNASSPLVVGDDRVFISESYGSGGAMLQILPPDAAGKLACKTLWTNPNFGTHFMSAIYRDGYLYGVDGHGPQDAFMVCVDAQTGKEMWRKLDEWKEPLVSPTGEHREFTMGSYRGWFMPVDGGILAQGEFGHLQWIELTPEGCKTIARAWLFRAGETWTPPVISRGLLYMCQNVRANAGGAKPRLICYDLRGVGK